MHPTADTLLVRLLSALAQMDIKISSAAPVLYFEVDEASGIGDRSAIVWHKGEAVFGPEWGGSYTAKAFTLFKQLEGLPPDLKLDIYRHRFTEDWVRHLEGDQ